MLTIEQEHAEFLRQLPEMCKQHEGDFALLRDGKLVGYFKRHEAAYEEAIRLFGIDSVFFIAQVREQVPVGTSLSWTAGVMFG
jgi:hypothetical protein